MFATIMLLAALTGAVQAHGPAGETPAAAEHGTATEHGAAAQGGHAAEEEHGFDILHHIQDSREIELPGGVIHLPAKGSWMIAGVDMTPTKHVVFLGLTGLLTMVVLVGAAGAARRTGHEGAPRGRHNIIEAMVLFIRDQVVMPNIGHGGERYAPFIITLFFFILFSNLLGLLPWGATATGNISVTAALALLSFIMIEVAGMRALGPKGYIGTIVYIPHGLPKALVPIMALIMTPVELVGKIVKPVALAIRLFANMTAGHVLILAIISLIFVFGSLAIALGPMVLAIALMFLELFVAFLQAFIFAMLVSVFIGLIVHAH
ncbi:MAG: F0F1 ATP synthase subunit A [Gemmatimonadetes bacterium]|nr:F0F1 ATP synthase subunit A [Gemmatimonadota bacterium]